MNNYQINIKIICRLANLDENNCTERALQRKHISGSAERVSNIFSAFRTNAIPNEYTYATNFIII